MSFRPNNAQPLGCLPIKDVKKKTPPRRCDEVELGT